MDDIFSRSLRTFLKPVLELWDESEVVELLIHGAEDIWVERHGKLEKARDVFFPEEDLNKAIRKIAQLMGVLVNDENPHFTKRLSNGTTVSIVLPPLSQSGPVLAIRKGQVGASTLQELCEQDFLTPAVADLLRAALVSQQSILLVGPTGSGIEALLASLVREIPGSERCIQIEREISQVLEHPNLLSFSMATEKGQHTLEELMPTMMMLRPHRVITEEICAEDSQTLLQWLARGYPGSLASMRAFHIQHALQLFEAYGLQSSLQLSASALRSQIPVAFPLLVGCRRQPTGRAYVEEVIELLPLTEEGMYQYLPLFRRQVLALHSEDAVIEPGEAGVLLPLGHIPSFWPRIRHWKGGVIDRAFFHPANYNSDGIRSENKAIPSMAPIGVSMEEERETPPPSFAPTRESDENSNSNPNPNRRRTPGVDALRARLESTAMARALEMGHSSAESESKEPTSVVAESPELPGKENNFVGNDLVTEPSRNLRELTKGVAPPSVSAVNNEDLNPFLMPPEADKEKIVVKDLSPSQPEPGPAKQSVQAKDSQALGPAAGALPSENTPLAQQVVLGVKPGLMDSVEFSTALTVSRTAPSKPDDAPTSSHVSLGQKDLATQPSRRRNMEPTGSQMLSALDIVADEQSAASDSVMSEEDVRRIQQELRQPLQRRSGSSTSTLDNPRLATEVVSRDSIPPGNLEPARQWPIPKVQPPYTDPEDTFRQGLSPLLGGVRPAAKTEPDQHSIPDDPSLSHISAESLEMSSSVLVKRGSRQVTPLLEHDGESTNIRAVPPPPPAYNPLRASNTGIPIHPQNPSQSSHTLNPAPAANPQASYTGMPAQNPGASYTGMPAQNPGASYTGMPAQNPGASYTGMPQQDDPGSSYTGIPQHNDIPRRPVASPPSASVPPPVPSSRVSGIRPPSTPPPKIVPMNGPTSDNGNEATLIRGRRPPQFKK